MERVGIAAIRRNGCLIRSHEVTCSKGDGILLQQSSPDLRESGARFSRPLSFSGPAWKIETRISTTELDLLTAGTGAQIAMAASAPGDVLSRFRCFDLNELFDLGPYTVWVKSGPTQVWWPYRICSDAEIVSREPLACARTSSGLFAPPYRIGANLAYSMEGFLNVFQCDAVSGAFGVWLREGWLRKGDPQTEHRFWAHNDAISRYLHMQTLPYLRQLTQVDWQPTFTSLLVYGHPADLVPHRDREQAALTISILVDYLVDTRRSEDRWPIYVQHEEDAAVPFGGLVGIGNAIAFTGQRMTHRRPQIEFGHEARVICLHYAEPGFEGKRL